MCYINHNCTLVKFGIGDNQYDNLVIVQSFCEVFYIAFLILCMVNSVQYLIIQKRYNKILLTAFYLFSLVSFSARVAAGAVNIVGYENMKKGVWGDRAQKSFSCTLDFKVSNKSELIAIVFKLAVGYFQVVSINELSFAIKIMKKRCT